MSDITKYIDKNGLIKPQESWNDSGNGVLYTVVAKSLGLLSLPEVIIPISNCLDFDKKVLMRTPDNQFGQESHDNWFALLALCLEHPKVGKMVAGWVVRRLGFMQNVDGRDNFFKSQILRFPHIWPLVIANLIQINIVKILCGIFLRFISKFDKFDENDASGIQLCYMKAYAAEILLDNDYEVQCFRLDVETKTRTTIDEIMSTYYSEGHPIVEGFKQLRLE